VNRAAGERAGGPAAGGAPLDWDARAYDRIARPQQAWGERVLAELELDGGEHVLDAGCGSGRLTELLAARLPRGRVTALDCSRAMLAEAQKRLARCAPRVRLIEIDLAELERIPLPVGPADVLFSTAALHWVRGHERLWAALARLLRPGGRVCVQYGGHGNLARAHAEFRAAAAESPRWSAALCLDDPWHFADVEETRASLEHAGIAVERVTLTDAPAHFSGLGELALFLEHIVLREYLQPLAPDERAALALRSAERIAAGRGACELDYVRLDVRGRRGLSGR
jgi:trans-aconitate 2-methyltransferase